jgi:hypothetical protein
MSHDLLCMWQGDSLGSQEAEHPSFEDLKMDPEDC